MLEVALVGTGGMMPLPQRYLSSLLLRHEGRMMLIDCGEGTQVSAKQVGWGFKNIDCICLTHFHADHVAGLPGLLLTIGGSGREEALTIVGPPGVAHIVESICIIAPEIPFPINFIEIPRGGRRDIKIPLTDFTLSALPADHNCPCFAYRVDIQRKGKFNLEAAESLGLPRRFWNPLQKGQNVEFEGQIFTPGMVMGVTRRGISVAYCTDSRPPRNMAAFIADCDLFVCEGHYGDDDKMDKAKKYKHMVFSEAAKLARDGNAARLWLTHFSPAMPNPEEFIDNARGVFPDAVVGYDRMVETLMFED